MAILTPTLAPFFEPSTSYAAVSVFERPDWRAVGLVMSILGSFLLANAILFRHPRRMVEELFRGEKRELRPIREYIFHRVQVSLGFLYLLAGFCLQLYGLVQPAVPGRGAPEFPTAWVGLVLLSVLALVVLGWWLSHALFRHYVRGYLMRHPFEFETEVKLAREVGELLGLQTASDETVQSYVARLRRRLGLLEPARAGERRSEKRRDSARDGEHVLQPEPEQELV